ncbi:MAG: hypothetical protein AAF378_11000 [Cyanobacteria bacterium P01_A01_bin.84]
MSYLKKPSVLQQQQELRKFVDKRLQNEEPKVKERVYQWLSDNQYFTDNELFDFYFCVAQNLAAVEILGASGEKIVEAKNELDQSAKAYTNQIVSTLNWLEAQFKGQLNSVQKNQQKLDTKLIQVLEGLSREHQNLQVISTGLVNSTSILLKKQKQLVIQTEAARRYAHRTIMVSWIIPFINFWGWIILLMLNDKM